MPWIEVFWTALSIEHLAEHGVSTSDAAHVIRNPIANGFSRTSGRPYAIGYTVDGRKLMVVYERLDEVTVQPVTAFEV